MLCCTYFPVLKGQKLVAHSIIREERYDQLKVTIYNDTDQKLTTAGYSTRKSKNPTEVLFGLMEGDSIWYIEYYCLSFRARNIYCENNRLDECNPYRCSIPRDDIAPGTHYEVIFNFHLNDNPLREKVYFGIRLFDGQNKTGWIYLFPLNFNAEIRKYPINTFLQCVSY